ncbi:MAG: YwiC-like family protein [Xenococcaceae cyanobacterium]
MTQIEVQATTKQQHKPNLQAWYRPTFSPEHGVYVVLSGSFLTGAALAQTWTLSTTLAFLAAFCGFQGEYPLGIQLKQRRSLKPRFLFWGGLYSAVSLGIAIWLYFRAPVLLWLYGGAIAALLVDVVEILRKERKSIVNELVTFAAVCLSAPMAYAVTTGTLTPLALGLWVLNALFFSSSIFTVKLRKLKTSSIVPGVIYHAIATLIVMGLYWFHWLSPFTALAFGVALLKFGLIAWQQQWYRTTKIQFVAILETVFALLFVAIAALTVLPAHLI